MKKSQNSILKNKGKKSIIKSLLILINIRKLSKKEEKNNQMNDNNNGVDKEEDTITNTTSNISHSDYSLEAKLKKMLDNDNSFDHDSMNIETFEFPGCIHENITPKSYTKKCNNLFIHLFIS